MNGFMHVWQDTFKIMVVFMNALALVACSMCWLTYMRYEYERRKVCAALPLFSLRGKEHAGLFFSFPRVSLWYFILWISNNCENCKNKNILIASRSYSTCFIHDSQANPLLSSYTALGLVCRHMQRIGCRQMFASSHHLAEELRELFSLRCLFECAKSCITFGM